MAYARIYHEKRPEIVHFDPIGTFHCDAKHRYEAARQPAVAAATSGHVALCPGRNLEQAVQDLDGFERVWLIYTFHHNPNWKPLVRPPRATRTFGVLATRAPYRPNPIGLSCVTLLGVHGLRIDIGPHDLLDGTPILDIKPYLPYADAFPSAGAGWVDTLTCERWELAFSPIATSQIAWLESAGVGMLRAFLQQQLTERPTDRDPKRKRIRPLDEPGHWEIAYRTWRARFQADPTTHTVTIQTLYGNYTPESLADPTDKYGDKAIHREFQRLFPSTPA